MVLGRNSQVGAARSRRAAVRGGLTRRLGAYFHSLGQLDAGRQARLFVATVTRVTVGIANENSTLSNGQGRGVVSLTVEGNRDGILAAIGWIKRDPPPRHACPVVPYPAEYNPLTITPPAGERAQQQQTRT